MDLSYVNPIFRFPDSPPEVSENYVYIKIHQIATYSIKRLISEPVQKVLN